MENFVAVRQWALDCWLADLPLEDMILEMIVQGWPNDVIETVCSELLDLDVLVLELEG